MFAPRSTALPTSSSTSTSIRPLVSNENVMNTTSSAKQSTTSFSTPGASMKRRAFGDISNKKSLASSAKSSGNKNTIVLKKTAFTPRSKLQQKPLLPKQPPGHSIRKPLSSTTSTTSVTKKPSQKAVLPRKTSSTAVNSGKQKTVVFETVDDVELPAGRLFSQQLENEDDDDLTELSDQEFIDNMWSSSNDWRTSFQKQYEEDCLKEDQELDRQVQQQMNEFFRKEQEEEEMKGIDSLLDLVDDLDLDLDHHDDDSWSQPATSVFGDDILDDSLLL
mmetsp:Transcript_3423/g.7810  ORF Transcript_3423/g.7810 Transcript_3423/m.7810 type:complete len:276 (-) Transcript_3423:235-1062(-)|eukprot:CAMPEP_0113635004 /NCGR_PEP_ID=MMETSP0017_2-20120614/18236_1 /TAXON_ID=2856 /ORGANISM="Cylindrotheca closterium" /LENGTH=275 /DNA_ID=CAMNT_0000545745 /DNA_START=92 /DNA_END=919 /DNA_ORIENTATION=- /assembly_acc=CAM_ASM_000147